MAKGFGRPLPARDALLPEAELVCCDALINLVLSPAQHAVHQQREFAGRGEDRNAAANGGTACALRALQGEGGHPQRGHEAVGAGAASLLPRKGLPPDGGARCQSQPTDKLALAGEGRQVEA